MIYLINSSNILLQDITLTRSAFWTIHLVGDRNVVVDNVKIINSRILQIVMV
jgi:polygalacturonase